MVVKHSVNLLMSKFSLVYKLMVYCAIVIAFFIGIGVGVIIPLSKPLVSGIVGTGFFEHLSEALNLFLRGDINYSFLLQQLNLDIVSIGNIIAENSGALAGSISIIVVFLVLANMVISFADVPTVDIINNFMTSKSNYGFCSNFLDNIKLSAKYALVRLLVTLVFDVGCTALAIYLSSLIFRFSGLFALFLFVAVSIGIGAFRQTLTATWLPEIVAGDKKIFYSFKKSSILTFKNFAKIFGNYYIIYLILLSVGILFSLTTFGVGLIFLVPICIVYSRCTELVFYYTLNGLSFYTSVDKIIKVDVVDLKSYEQSENPAALLEDSALNQNLPVLYNHDQKALSDENNEKSLVVKVKDDKNSQKALMPIAEKKEKRDRRSKPKTRLTNIKNDIEE